MASDEFPDLTLENIGGGAAGELFDRELEQVIKNIADVETDAEAARTISLKFTFKPFKNRKGANVGIRATSSLGAAKSAEAMMFLAREGGHLIALTHNPEQMDLIDDEADDQIVSIDREGTHGQPG